MKNLFFTALVFIFSISQINAQADSTSPEIGVKAGVNFATITGDDIDDLDSRTSFNVGLFMELPLSERFSFQPELLYSGQGFTIMSNNQDNVFDTDENVEYQLSYIQVPLLAKIYLIEGLSIEAGPQFGFKINEEIDTEPASDGGETVIDPDDSYIKDFDTSLALGAGYKFNNGFFVNARYTHGLTNIFKENTILENVDAKNAVWQFGLGFTF
jgi:hypothetical protein